jgi:hypothetical protein
MLLFDPLCRGAVCRLQSASWGSSRAVARGAKGVANASPQQPAGMSGARCGGGLCAMSKGRSFGGSERHAASGTLPALVIVQQRRI